MEATDQPLKAKMAVQDLLLDQNSSILMVSIQLNSLEVKLVRILTLRIIKKNLIQTRQYYRLHTDNVIIYHENDSKQSKIH